MDAHIKVAVIHHHRLFRESLGIALNQDPDISLCCQISSLDEIPRQWDAPCPDIVLVEMSERSRDFWGRVNNLRSKCPDCQIIMIDVPECDETVLACIEVAGAMGYLTRDASLDEVVYAIRSVMSGEAICPPRVTGLLISRVSELSRQVDVGQFQPPSGLTRREQTIVKAVEEGLSNKEIAIQLGIEVSTVKNHIHNILDKLQVHDRQSAVRYLKEHGMSTPVH